MGDPFVLVKERALSRLNSLIDSSPFLTLIFTASGRSAGIGGSSAVAGTASGLHIDPGQTIYVDLAPNDELWATSTPNGLVVQVLDMRRND